MKKNLKDLILKKKLNQKTPKYGKRKLSVGVVSLILAFSILSPCVFVKNGVAKNIFIKAQEEKIEINETNFPDENFRKAVQEIIKRELHLSDLPTSITKEEIKNVKQILISTDKNYGKEEYKNIKNLKGLEKFTSITLLTLNGIEIENIPGLESFKNLKSLSVYGSKISDISDLANLTELEELILFKNQITDISALQNLTNLKKLNLYNNQITGISALAKLTNLTQLVLANNQITDISAVQNLTNLTELDVKHNQITDISAVQNLTNLTNLYINNNKITDISVLQNLTNLKVLFMDSNKIKDISVLKNFKNLNGDSIGISNNQIKDITLYQEKAYNLENAAWQYLGGLYLENNNESQGEYKFDYVVKDRTFTEPVVKLLDSDYKEHNLSQKITFDKTTKTVTFPKDVKYSELPDFLYLVVYENNIPTFYVAIFFGKSKAKESVKDYAKQKLEELKNDGAYKPLEKDEAKKKIDAILKNMDKSFENKYEKDFAEVVKGLKKEMDDSIKKLVPEKPAVKEVTEGEMLLKIKVPSLGDKIEITKGTETFIVTKEGTSWKVNGQQIQEKEGYLEVTISKAIKDEEIKVVVKNTKHQDAVSEETKIKVKEKEKLTLNKPTEKVKVKDTNALTEEEKGKVKEAVKDANKNLNLSDTEIEVDEKGNVKVTKDNKEGKLEGKDLVEKEVTPAPKEKLTLNKPATKVKVKDTNALTKEEKGKVKEAVKDANKNLNLSDTEIEVDEKGNVKVTKDNKEGEIKGTDLVEKEVTPAPKEKLTLIKPTEKVKVKDTNALTEEEKTKVKEAVKNANTNLNLSDTEIEVDGKGNVTVTKDNKEGEIKGTDLVEKEVTPAPKEKLTLNKPTEKVKVKNVDALTEEEKTKVKEAVKNANASLNLSDTEIEVDEKGNVKVTKDNKEGKIKGTDLVEKETAEAPKEKPQPNPTLPGESGKNDNNGNAGNNGQNNGQNNENSGNENVNTQKPEIKLPDKKVKVKDPNKLTKEEKEKIEKEIRNKNKDLSKDSKVEIEDTGNIIIKDKNNKIIKKLKVKDLIEKETSKNNLKTKKESKNKLPKTSIASSSIVGAIISLVGAILSKKRR